MRRSWSGDIVVVTAYPGETKQTVKLIEAQLGEMGQVYVFDAVEMPKTSPEALYLADLSDAAKVLRNAGFAVAGWEHAENEGQDFSYLEYVVSKPEELEWEEYDELWNRITGNPCDILETERLYVRETTVEDVSAFYEIYKDAEITRYMENLFADSDEEKAYQEMYIRNVYGLYGYGVWTVIEKESGQIIGRAGIAPREGFVEPELGFVIGTKWQKKGYAYEVCDAIINYAMCDLQIEDIIAVVHRENTASIKLCEKLGLVDTGEEVVKDYKKFSTKRIDNQKSE